MQPSDSLVSIGRRSGHPSSTTYLSADACSSPSGTRTCQRAERRRSITGSPSHRFPAAERQGLPRLLSRPLRACRGRRPRRMRLPPRPLTVRSLLPSGKTKPSASEMNIVFVAAWPTAHTLAYLRIAERVTAHVARLATDPGGLSPDRAGLAPAGRQTMFHEVIAYSTPHRPAFPGRTVDPIPPLSSSCPRHRVARTPFGSANTATSEVKPDR